MVAALVLTAIFAPQRFKTWAIVYTALYFAFAAASTIRRKQ